MAVRKEQFQQSDVTFWGISAMVAGGFAVLSTSVGAFLPAGFFGGLHANRLEGGTLNQLRAQVELLNAAQRDLLSSANQLRTQFTLAERNRAQVNQRVGALEISIPMLLEVVPPGAEIDPLSITASIDDNESTLFEADGGSVRVVQTPLFEGANTIDASSTSEQIQPSSQSLPDALDAQENSPDTFLDESFSEDEEPTSQTQSVLPVLPNADSLGEASIEISQTQFGIAVGPIVTLSEADAVWEDIAGKIGTLLIGLEPAISDPLQNNNFRVVLGPINNYSEAETLCKRVTQVGIDCLPIQYANPQISSL